MKLIIAAVLALAVCSEASFPYPAAHPVVPAAVYGLPEEAKPVLPATVYGVPDEVRPLAPLTPIKSEYSYTLGSLPTTSYPAAQPVVPATVYGVPEEVKPLAPLTPVNTEYPYALPSLPIHEETLHEEVELVAPAAPSVEIHGPSSVTTIVNGVEQPQYYPLPQAPISPFYQHPALFDYSGYSSVLPQFYNLPPISPGVYNPGYSFPAYTHSLPAYTHSLPGYPHSRPAYTHAALEYPSGYDYAYSAPQVPLQQVVYEQSAPSVSVVSSGVSVVHPLPEAHVEHEVHEVAEPLVTNYEYEIPKLVAQEVVVEKIPKPIVPQTVYGVPN